MSVFVLKEYLSDKYISAIDPFPQESKETTQLYPFYDALKEGRLTTTSCKSCGKVSWPPRSLICPECYSEDLEWINLPTTGKVVEFVEMAMQLVPHIQAPMILALIDFGGKLKYVSRILGIQMGELKVGDEVKLKIFPVEPVPLEDRKGNVDLKERVFYAFEKA